jgi:WXXGXW repeat (2 copies)
MNKSAKALLMGLCIVGSAAVAPVSAFAGIGVNIDIAPPEPRFEVAPQPRPGYVWAPGYWDYRHRQHVWVPGRYRGERHGYHWAPDRWEQQGPRWHRAPGHWER